MELKNNYYILRHGETTHQTKRKDFTYSSLENKTARLTKKGENQIKTAANKLKKEKIDLIFSSDFFRTRQTAGIVAKELGLKIYFDKRLRDLNIGVYHGQEKEKFYQDFPEYSKKRFVKRPQGGESWRDLQKRMLNFLKEIDNKHKGKTILIVSHGDPLWLLHGAVKGFKQKEFLDRKRPGKNYHRLGQLKELY